MVQAIHINRRLALTDEGDTIPITMLIDEDGDHTDDPYDAISFVAGDDQHGWHTGLISDYQTTQTLN